MANKKQKTLQDYLLTVSKVLGEFQKKSIINSYALIGGLAVGAIGIPRATKDVDFLVSTDNSKNFYKEFKSVLNNKEYYFKYEKSEGSSFQYNSIICSVKDKGEEIRIIDVLITTRNWQEEISEYTVKINYGKTSIPVANTEGLIILKLHAGGPMDMIDIENILKSVDIDKLDRKMMFDWARRAGVDKLLTEILKEKKWTK